MSASGQPPKFPKKFNINAKTITAPLAAFTMACLLFVYARTSIQAAKRNAQSHREADGGQISWRNESLRRHGQLEAPASAENKVVGVVGQLVRQQREGDVRTPRDSAVPRGEGETVEERMIRDRAQGGSGRVE